MNPSVFQSREKLLVICCLLLVLASIALYNPISRAPFLNYDDDYYVILNPHVRAGLTWSTVNWAFHTTEAANWHPLTWLSHALDVQLFGMNPAGHHYINVLLHALNVVLLFLFLEWSTGLPWRSLMVAALFAIHPINVESVAWISERKNVLSMAFFLLGLIAYVCYARNPGIRRYLLVLVCFAAGLMAKPQVITFPFVLLLIDYWPLQRVVSPKEAAAKTPPIFRPQSFSRLLVEKIPLFILSAASALITIQVQTTAIHDEYPLSVRMANAALAYLMYMRRAVWPLHLAPLYPYPGFAINSVLVSVGALALIAISVYVVLARSRRYLLVGWFWFLGVLVPMIGLVQVGVQAMADRYAYIPFIGLFILLCWGVGDVLRSAHVPRIAVHAASATGLILLAIVCHGQIGYWDDNLTLWTHTLQVTKNNFVAEDNVGMALVVKGKPDEANLHFQKAVEINPSDPVANLNLAAYEADHGNYAAAIARYDNIPQLTTNPRMLTSALANRGVAYYRLREYDEARRSFDAALRIFPENSMANMGLGLLAQKDNHFQQAADDFTRSVQFQPTDVGYLLLAEALEAAGQNDAAHTARVQAERISSNLGRATMQVSQLLAN